MYQYSTLYVLYIVHCTYTVHCTCSLHSIYNVLYIEKSGGKTVNAASIQKAKATAQLIFTPKRPRVFLRAGFGDEPMTQSTQTPQTRNFKWRRRCQDYLPASLFSQYCHRGSWWLNFHCPRTASRRACGGTLNHR
jgi:hypothetical protein